jgi:uncharacterized protein (DUF885 family)
MFLRVLPAASAVFLLLTTPVSAAKPSSELKKLCGEYWEEYLEANPTAATSIGDRRYDDRLSDITPAGIAKEKSRLSSVLSFARAIDEKQLSPEDQLTRTALITEVEGQIAALSCGFEEWVVDPLNGPQVEYMNLAEYTTIEKPADAAKYVRRVWVMGKNLEDHIRNLQTGLKKGRTASRDAVAKTIDQLSALVDSPMESLAVWKPSTVHREGWEPGDRWKFTNDLRTSLESSLVPVLRRYRDFLRDEVLPKARPQDKAGLAGLLGGPECYRKMIRVHTSVDVSAEDVHKLGLEQVAKYRKDLGELGQKVFGTSDVGEIQRRLRTDPKMQFETAQEIESKAREALARANAEMPKWFGIQPKATCEVKVMGMYEAPYSTIAYYRQGTPDGKRPGTYMINTYLPETRPRYEAEALAFHEAVPGHHLQIAIAQELKGIPEFRKHQGVTAFVEGWALYTERLSDEMGLYSSDTDRLGMLSYDAWRACRLVVDTGLHAKGWSRQQAIDYMLENSCLAKNNIVNEVDRYLTWPGQALAYKLGQLKILELREKAKTRLGTQFDIKKFHDAVLSNGAVALPVLEQQVDAWVNGAVAAK